MAGPIRIAILGDASNATRAFAQTEQAAGKMRSRMAGFASGVAKTVGAVGVAAGGLAVTMGAVGLKTAASMQQSQIAFKTLLGSAQESQKFLGGLAKFATKTSFTMPGLVDASRQLIGAGASAKQVIPTLTAYGNASAALGLNQEQFGRIMLATTQAMGRGKIQGDDLLQMVNAGLPVWPLMSKALGKPVSELQKMSQKGELVASKVLPKLEAQMQKDYGGAMGESAKTLAGQWSTLTDTFQMGLAEAIMPLTPALGEVAAAATTLLSGSLAKLTSWMTGTAVPAINTFRAQWKAGIDGTLGGETRQILTTIGTAIAGLFAGGTSTETATAFKGLGENVGKLAPLFVQLRDALPSFNDLINVAGTVIGFLADHQQTLADSMPIIIGLFIAWKVGQLAANVATAASIPLRIAEVAATTRQTFAMNAHTAALRANTGATLTSAGVTATGVAAENAGIVARLRSIASMAGQRVAMLASAAASGINSASIAAYVAVQNLEIGTRLRSIASIVAQRAAMIAGAAATGIASAATAAMVAVENLGIAARARSIVGMVAQRAAMVATATATGIWTAAQWLLNVALTANPIGLLVVGIALLIGAIVWIATKTTWFQDIWRVVWLNIKTIALGIWNVIKIGAAAFMATLRAYISVGVAVIKGVWAGLKFLASIAVSVWNGVKSAFSAAVGFVKGLINNAVQGALIVWGRLTQLGAKAREVVQAVIGIFRGWVSTMLAIPGQIVDGLVNGLSNAWGRVTAKVTELVNSVKDIAGDILELGSPSKLFARIGKFVGQGFIIGLTSTESRIKSTMAKLAGLVREAFTGRRESGLVRSISRDTGRLVTLVRRRGTVAAQLAAQNTRLGDLLKARADLAASVADTVRGTFALIEQGEEGAGVTTGGILKRAQAAVAQATAFAVALAKLRGRGLNASMIAELGKAGPAAGLATANALLKGTPGQISRLNNAFADLGKAASTAGNTVAGSMYDAGINAARGLIAGLAKQRAGIEKLMLAIAAAMQKSIKRALGIRSPSSVFAQIGRQTIQGFAEGFQSISGRQLVGDLRTGLVNASTSIPAVPLVGGGAAAAGATVVNVNVTDMHADPAEVGRQIVKLVRAYEAATGREMLAAGA